MNTYTGCTGRNRDKRLGIALMALRKRDGELAKRQRTGMPNFASQKDIPKNISLFNSHKDPLAFTSIAFEFEFGFILV